MDSTLEIKPLKYYLRISLSIHVAILFIAGMVSFFYGKKINKIRIYNTKLVQSSVRVDVVAMPQLTLKELQALEQTPPQKTAKSIEPVKTLPAPKESLSFQEMIKKMSKKKIKKKHGSKSQANEEGLTSAEKARLKNLLMAGNKIRRGSSLTGKGDAANLSGFALYISSLPKKIRPFWRLPTYLQDKGLRCRIRIFLGPQGN